MNPAPPVTKHCIDRYHPVPHITTQAVRIRILKSSHSDQLSIYSRSILTHSSKLQILFLPLTCQRQVIPGLMLSFRLCQNSYRSSSCRKAGRGPTRLISPLSTLHNCGSSLRLYFRRKRPKDVVRGSFLILNTGPCISLRSRN